MLYICVQYINMNPWRCFCLHSFQALNLWLAWRFGTISWEAIPLPCHILTTNPEWVALFRDYLLYDGLIFMLFPLWLWRGRDNNNSVIKTCEQCYFDFDCQLTMSRSDFKNCCTTQAVKAWAKMLATNTITSVDKVVIKLN